ncbi:MAG TPA: head GIN domain-containing protein [Anaerolineales bacterium]
MKKYPLIQILLMVLLVTSCSARIMRGSGNTITETRQVSGFDQVSVCCGMQLVVAQGSAEALEIQADDNLLPEITSVVAGDELVIEFQDSFLETSYRPSQPVQVFVTVQSIEGLDVSGGGRLETRNLRADDLEVNLSGGSRGDFEGVVASGQVVVEVSGGGRLQAEQIETSSLALNLSGGSEAMIADLEAETLILDNSGGGNALIGGQASEQIIELSGASDYDAPDLLSQTATVQMSGGGSARVWVTESLIADLSGGSEVEYYGDPEVTEKLSGGSGITPLGNK